MDQNKYLKIPGIFDYTFFLFFDVHNSTNRIVRVYTNTTGSRKYFPFRRLFDINYIILLLAVRILFFENVLTSNTYYGI